MKRNLFCACGVLSLLLACYCVSFDTHSIGQEVPDSVASELRGGACGNIVQISCPGNNTKACPSSTKAVGGGNNKAKGNGDSPCGSSCGSYYKTTVHCSE